MGCFMTNYPQKNLLASQTSPYLRQHADNPVHWRPWSRDALDEAALHQRPILLSIGYAACHWCHVMAHESFENEAVAAVMNRLFVNIKVDREERPDIDQIYMNALQAIGEQGGWPLTMFLTPDAFPFWGGTYFPPSPRHGRPGFVEVLEAVAKTWSERRHEIDRSATALKAHVATQLAPTADPKAEPGSLSAFADAICSMIDLDRGGLRGAPKFPNAPMMKVLRLNGLQNRNNKHSEAAIVSLRNMLAGGIYDHIGGGLCRYSTDAEWLIPHFEKMLYDNAQLIDLAGWAYAVTDDELFRMRIEETVDWLSREMVAPGGGFASSLDADSDGQEGLFYLWNRDEVVEILGSENSRRFFELYQLALPSHEIVKPILHRLSSSQLSQADTSPDIRAMKLKLRETRDHRTRPGRDDKVLVDWNGLTISALARAGRQFSKPSWVSMAVNAFRFVSESADGDRLPHSISANQRLFPGLSIDYAAMITAAVTLFESTGDQTYLSSAQKWMTSLDRWHGDDSGTGHFLTAADSTDVPIRIRGDIDEAIPSATAQIIEAMTRLSLATSDHHLYERALVTFDQASRRIGDRRYGQAGIIHARALAEEPRKLILVAARDSNLVSAANRFPDPGRTDIILDPATDSGSTQLPDGTRISTATPGAWLCLGQTCLPPIRDATTLQARLRHAKA